MEVICNVSQSTVSIKIDYPKTYFSNVFLKCIHSYIERKMTGIPKPPHTIGDADCLRLRGTDSSRRVDC